MRELEVLAEVLRVVANQDRKPKPRRHEPRRERKPRHRKVESDYDIVQVLNDESFDSGRFRILEQWHRGRPITTKAAVKVIGTFTFRSNQEKVAKMLAPFVTDRWAYEHALREELGFSPWFRA